MDNIEQLKQVLPRIENTVKGLRKESATSLCGPCPKCEGDDRFVYRTDQGRFWCRNCNEKGGDIIDFHTWIEGTDVKGLMKKHLPKDTNKNPPTSHQSTPLEEPFEHYELGFPFEKYPYKNEKGKTIKYNCRFDPKAFRQCDPTGLNWKVKDIKPDVPYNLLKVIQTDTVFVVEGEKDVHSLAKLNLVGTCNAGGAGNWNEDLNQYFKGKKVYLVSDNDEPGRKHVQKVYQHLKDIADSIFNIELDGQPVGGDFTDWLARFNDIDEAGERFAIMVEGAQPIKTEGAEGPPKIEVVCVESIAEQEFEDNPTIDGLLDEKESLILSAESGTGKSLFMNYLALALGNPPQNGLWGLFNIPNVVRSLIVQSENNLKSFNVRLNKIFNVSPDMRAGVKNVFTIKVGNDCRVAGSLTDKDFQKLLIDSLLSVGAHNLILDPLISYHGEDENDNAGMRRSLDCLTMICDQANASCMVCHHYNRLKQTRGAASIRDWASNMLLMDFVEKEGNSTILKITHDKSRNYEQQPEFYLERTPDFQFLRCEKPGKQSEQVNAVITAMITMGGYAESQATLKNAIMVELNCGETTARRAIDEALKLKKLIINPGKGKGNPCTYELPKE